MSILPLSEISRLLQDRGVKTSGFLQAIAKGPSSHLPRVERRQRRAAIRSLRMQLDGCSTRTTTVLLYEPDVSHWFTVRFNSRWCRGLSQLLAPSLDRKLAEGRSPESGLLLAVRAQVLVSPANRQTLAYDWADLLARARTAPGVRDPRVPIDRDSILANEPDIQALLDVLVAQSPGQVRGIALMSWLLSNGAGPLYIGQRADPLRGALSEAAALLDPAAI